MSGVCGVSVSHIEQRVGVLVANGVSKVAVSLQLARLVVRQQWREPIAMLLQSALFRGITDMATCLRDAQRAQLVVDNQHRLRGFELQARARRAVHLHVQRELVLMSVGR